MNPRVIAARRIEVYFDVIDKYWYLTELPEASKIQAKNHLLRQVAISEKFSNYIRFTNLFTWSSVRELAEVWPCLSDRFDEAWSPVKERLNESNEECLISLTVR